MRHTLFLAAALLLVSPLAAFPGGNADDPSSMFPAALADLSPLAVQSHPYKGDGRDPSVSRSPCPFLNTAANHDILPYNGKGIHKLVFGRLLRKVGLSDRAASMFENGIAKVAKHYREKDPKHPEDIIDLGDLNEHALIEHDLSLSRYDIDEHHEGDNFAKSEMMDRFLTFTANYLKKNGNPVEGLKYDITVTTLGAWHDERLRMETEERHRHPDNSIKTKFLCAGECALLLNVLGRDGKISAKDANMFLYRERFPDGWTPAVGMSDVYFFGRVAECAAAFAVKESWLSWLNKPHSWSLWGWFHGSEDCADCQTAVKTFGWW